jgi:hypothetical protein
MSTIGVNGAPEVMLPYRVSDAQRDNERSTESWTE